MCGSLGLPILVWAISGASRLKKWAPWNLWCRKPNKSLDRSLPNLHEAVIEKKRFWLSSADYYIVLISRGLNVKLHAINICKEHSLSHIPQRRVSLWGFGLENINTRPSGSFASERLKIVTSMLPHSCWYPTRCSVRAPPARFSRTVGVCTRLLYHPHNPLFPAAAWNNELYFRFETWQQRRALFFRFVGWS